MSCPHSSQRGPCSSCSGAVAKRIEIQGGITYVDGVPASTSSETAAQMPQPRSVKHRYGRRPK